MSAQRRISATWRLRSTLAPSQAHTTAIASVRASAPGVAAGAPAPSGAPGGTVETGASRVIPR